MKRRRASLASALVALLVAMSALAPAPAHADGDPASDVLVSQALFLPYDTGVSPAQQAQLEALLRTAQRAGFPIRVAMIPSEYDLGSVGVLWRHPSTYARFLGIELSLTYSQRLLVVMPNGFGLNWPHHATAASERVLAQVPIGDTGAGLLQATEVAVRRLATAAGITLSSSAAPASPPASSTSAVAPSDADGLSPSTVPPSTSPSPSASTSPSTSSSPNSTSSSSSSSSSSLSSSSTSLLAALTGALVAFLIGIGLVFGLRRAAVGLTVMAVGLGVFIVVLIGYEPSAGKSTNSNADTNTNTNASLSLSGEGPTVWPAGQRPAPDFELTDQQGHSISPADYRGRPLIVTFIDPLCRNLCPLAGKILSEADQRLPPGQRAGIIAVSVDIYADTPADLQQDYRRWSLVPQWQWAVGSPGRLASVWKRYYAEVEVETKHIAGTTVHYITHSEMAYLIDGRGDERALFTWPYTAQQIDTVVRRLSRS